MHAPNGKGRPAGTPDSGKLIYREAPDQSKAYSAYQTASLIDLSGLYAVNAAHG